MNAILFQLDRSRDSLRRLLRFDSYAEMRPATWSRRWSYEVEREEGGGWTVEIWAGRTYVVFGQTPRRVPTTGIACG